MTPRDWFELGRMALISVLMSTLLYSTTRAVIEMARGEE